MSEKRSKLEVFFRSTEFQFIAPSISEKLLKKWDYTLSPGSQNNLSLQAEHLEHGSLVMIINHITKDDPFLAISIAIGDFRGLIHALLVPMGEQHYSEFQEKGPLHTYFIRHSASLGTWICPVPQEYRQESYLPGEAFSMKKNFLRTAKYYLAYPGTLLAIAPEETRSHNGQLQEAKPGIEHLHKYGNVCYATWAIVPTGPYDREQGLTEVEVRIGPPQTQEGFEREWQQQGRPNGTPFKDILMYNLAENLPVHMRGVYSL